MAVAQWMKTEVGVKTGGALVKGIHQHQSEAGFIRKALSVLQNVQQ